MNDPDEPRTKRAPILSPRFGKGKELCDLLRAELGIPESAIYFEVRVAVDEPITVLCHYNATERPKA